MLTAATTRVIRQAIAARPMHPAVTAITAANRFRLTEAIQRRVMVIAAPATVKAMAAVLTVVVVTAAAPAVTDRL
jgi:hypothetical protein